MSLKRVLKKSLKMSRVQNKGAKKKGAKKKGEKERVNAKG